MTAFTSRPPRQAPPGAERWDWHWKVYAACASPIAVAEAHGIWVNAVQRREVRGGLRGQVDYCHRTITECVTALAAIHPDTRRGPYAKLRRLALLVLLAWMVVHFFSDGEEM